MNKKKLTYSIIEGIPGEVVLAKLLKVYDVLFEDAKLNFFVRRVQEKKDLITILCFEKDLLVGFKLGYQYNETTFYSWVGGVLPTQRKQGIAQKLMLLQHKKAKEKGYKKMRTKSMNRFKPMMILNLKSGFNIVNVYTNDSGQTKIIFEKLLLDH